MTKQYDNELRGVLFKNDEKEAGSSHADYRGNATIEGVDYFMDVWVNAAESGRKYMSVKFKAKNKQKQAAPAPAPKTQPRSRVEDMDSDVPF